jgi:hypothetical protein
MHNCVIEEQAAAKPRQRRQKSKPNRWMEEFRELGADLGASA